MNVRWAKELRIAKRLSLYLKPHSWAIATIVALGILSSLAEGIGIGLFIPLLKGVGSLSGSGGSRLASILESLVGWIPAEDRQTTVLACIVFAVAAKAALTFSYGILTQRLYSLVSHQLRSAAFEQLTKVGYPFILRSRAGSLHYTLATSTWQTGDAVGMLLNLTVTISTAAVYVLLLLLISWKLTLGIAVALFLISTIGSRLVRRAAVLGRLLRRANLGLAHRMFQTLHGIKVIQTFGRAGYEQNRFDAVSVRVSRILFHLGVVRGAVAPLYELLIVILLIGVLAIGIRNPEIMPSLIVFIVLLYRLQPKIRQIDSIRVSLSSSAAAVEDLISLLNVHDKPYPSSGHIEFDRLREGISLEHVAFRYDGAEIAALKNLSIYIPANKTTALVGRSGSGKSTLINLLIRLFEPSSGQIRVDGIDLGQIDLDSWRRRIAVVSQDIYMFDATVRENIAYGNLAASEEEIVRAARQANAFEFITELPQGWNTVVGERGARLSGGQQQRIALARAIVRDPEILILDEATNALDAISEKLIRQALERIGRNRTVVVIAHRLSTVDNADQVLVLSDGQVVEAGSPAELLKKGGMFSQLHRMHFDAEPESMQQ